MSKQIQFILLGDIKKTCEQKMNLVTNSKQPIQTTIFRGSLTMKKMCWWQKISVFCLSPKCHSFKRKLGKGTVPKTNVALESLGGGKMTFLFTFRECHASSVGAATPLPLPLSRQSRTHCRFWICLSVASLAGYIPKKDYKSVATLLV